MSSSSENAEVGIEKADSGFFSKLRSFGLYVPPSESEQKEIEKRKKMQHKLAQLAEKREAKRQELLRREREQREKRVVRSINKWVDEVLPKWNIKKKLKATQTLCWQGIPPGVRGKAWLVIFNRCLYKRMRIDCIYYFFFF